MPIENEKIENRKQAWSLHIVPGPRYLTLSFNHESVAAAITDPSWSHARADRATILMAKYDRFEDLPVWQEAARLYNRVLDLLETSSVPLSSGFRYQLDRAALSVSNNIAEGFERVTTEQLLSFISIARGSSAEVRSMMAVVNDRPKLKPFISALQEIRMLAESCSRQLSSWSSTVQDSPVQGSRFLNRQMRENRRAAQAAKNFRLNFLRSLKPEHPLYRSAEARKARGEIDE